MELIEFLTARLAEDQQYGIATKAMEETIPQMLGGSPLTALMGERMLREVEAKRDILAEALDCFEHGPATGNDVPCPILHALAAVYSDHPDFDPAWKPEGARPCAGKQ